MAGGHGGRRPGAGRKFGSRQLYTVQKSVENATQFLRTNNIRVFEGDSVALMISVYKNEDLPLNIRLQCAMAVAPFERPRLVATANLHKNVDSAAAGLRAGRGHRHAARGNRRVRVRACILFV